MISSTLWLEATVTGLVDILEIHPGCGLTSLSMTMRTYTTVIVRENVCIKAAATMEMDGPLQAAQAQVFTTLAS